VEWLAPSIHIQAQAINTPTSIVMLWEKNQRKPNKNIKTKGITFVIYG
jgi:DNA-binding transcriptional regulator YiaG